jgi:hypothetical protein
MKRRNKVPPRQKQAFQLIFVVQKPTLLRQNHHSVSPIIKDLVVEPVETTCHCNFDWLNHREQFKKTAFLWHMETLLSSGSFSADKDAGTE